MSFLTVEGLSLRFGGVHAVRDLGFTVQKGEIFAIIGPNGAGKTSVLNVMTGVFPPTSGRILFKDADLTRLPRHMAARHGVARTFQNIELFEGESVLHNVLLGRHRFPHGSLFGQIVRTPEVRRIEEESRARAEDIIDLLDLAPYRNLPVAALSYGVRKIVELARALATEPELLLLDEPASGLNPEETRDLSFWLEDIRSDLGVTIIMVEHDMSLVSACAGRVLCMNMGHPLALGTPAEVQSHPDVVAAYLGG
jgi:branched-chain amino acid transport system ATP-binding protein